MDEKKKKELKRLAAIADSLFYHADELMGMMEIVDSDGRYDVSPEDADAYIAIGDLHSIIDEHRWRIRNICDKLK